jgi:hypothetical protein
VEKSEPVAFCKICTGPIYTGEPVVGYDDGLAHRFKTWCSYFQDLIIERDKAFLKDLKISGED